MKILLLNFSHLKFDVSTPEKEPLGGTESSVCWLARKLVETGHQVTLMGSGTVGDVLGVQHWPMSDLMGLDVKNWDICISVNSTTAARWAKSKGIKSVVWFHMMPDQPSMSSTRFDGVDLAVYVSEAQKTAMEMYYGSAPQSVVIGHAVAPCFENLFTGPDEILATKECRGVYMTTPFRGLTYLLDAVIGLNLPLDIFSSMKTYQGDDTGYDDIYKRCGTRRKNVLAQPDLVGEIKKAAFLTYPCIFKETFCLSALEAMACGLKVISTTLGALPTTTMGFGDLIEVDYVDSKNFVRGYTDQLKWNMAQFKSKPKEWSDNIWKQVQEVNEKCVWSVKIKEWESVLWT